MPSHEHGNRATPLCGTQLLVPALGEGQDVDDEVFEELRNAGRDVAVFGSEATARTARRVVESTDAARTMSLPEDQGDRYGIAEIVNDGYESVVSDYLRAVRKEIGTER